MREFWHGTGPGGCDLAGVQAGAAADVGDEPCPHWFPRDAVPVARPVR
jgi:hypothetical protein